MMLKRNTYSYKYICYLSNSSLSKENRLEIMDSPMYFLIS